MVPPNFHWNDDLSLTHKGMGPLPQQPTSPAGAETTEPRTDRADAPEPPRPEAEPARYKLGARLGRNGQVYEARSDRYPGRLVVKLMPFATGLAPAAVRAFTQEATRVAELRHPHIVPLIAAGVMADATPFLAMEPLAGETLEDRMSRNRAFSLGDVLPVVRGLASALSAAHGSGVIHREVRADNVFISDLPGYGLGFARLLDFGVSRLTAAARDAGRIVAPAAWRVLAPEQQQGSLAALGDHGWQELLERAGERTDQFALAALTYRLLTGIEPIAGQEVESAFERVRDERAERCPPAVDFVLCKALARRPEQRYDSVALFFRAFEEACVTSPADDRRGMVVRRAERPLTPEPGLAPGPSRTSRNGLSGAVRADDDETRPAISGIVPATGPVQPASTEAPTVVSWSGAGPDRGARDAGTSRRSPPARPAAGLATAPGALTQQFFAEGDRQEAEWLQAMARRRSGAHDAGSSPDASAAGLPGVRRDDLTGGLAELGWGSASDDADRVPRGRVPLLVAGIGVALLGFGAVGWAIGLWSPPVGPFGRPVATAPGSAPAGETSRGNAPAIPPPVPTPQPAPAAAREPNAPVAPVAAAPAPPARVAPTVPEPAAPTGGPQPQLDDVVGRREPVRGMAWSSNRGKMVRSRLAPLPTESPPPPPFTGAPAVSSPPPPTPELPAPQGWTPPAAQQAAAPEVQVTPGWPPPGAYPPAASPPAAYPPPAYPPPATYPEAAHPAYPQDAYPPATLPPASAAPSGAGEPPPGPALP